MGKGGMEGGKISLFARLTDSLPSTQLFRSLHSFSVHICSRNELCRPLKHELYKFQMGPLPFFEWNAALSVCLSVCRSVGAFLLPVHITVF